ncbi:hypothetical protein Tco_0741197 [Tanacetum coccineum]
MNKYCVGLVENNNRLESENTDAKQGAKDVNRIVKGDEDESHLLNLPTHVLELMLMEFCVGVEYLKFRSTCKRCHLAAPLITCNNGKASTRLREYTLLSPWLILFDKRKGIITLTDPVSGDKYFIRTPQELICDLEIKDSRYGCLLIIKSGGSLIFYNPFTSDIHELPQLDDSDIFSFSAPPTSPGCMVVGITIDAYYYHVCIHFVGGEPSWRRNLLDIWGDDCYSSLTVFGRDLYALRDDRGLDSFLLRCGEHLLQVILGKFEESVEVFKLNDSTQEWVKLDSLGKHVIFIWGRSSLCIDAKTPQMENKIYFPRLPAENENLNDMVFYSLETCRNTIELPEGNNVVPLRSDTIRLVQNGCSFHGLRSEDPNQHFKDFLKLKDPSPHGRILLLVSLLNSFPPGRIAKLCNDILMFQQHQGESLSKAWTRFKDLLQKVPHHGFNLWLQVQIFYDHVNPVTRQTIDQSAGGKLHDKNTKESWALLEDLTLYDNKSWNDPRDFAKPVKAISLPQDVSSPSDCYLIELENQVQRLMEAHLAPKQPAQVNKISFSCEICSGPHDTQYCMENPEQAFVDYASSHTDKAGGKWFSFKPEQNNLGDTYNPSWKSHPNLRWRQPQNSQNNFSNPPNRFQPNGSFLNLSFNNNPQNFNNQSNLERLVSNFMASQDVRLSKFEADFKQQQSEMTNKIDTVLETITDRITGALPSDTVKNPKLSINYNTLVLSTRSYRMEDPQCSSQIHSSINTITTCPKQPNKPHNNKSEEEERKEKSNPKKIDTTPPSPPDPSISLIMEKVRKLNSFLELSGLIPQSSDTEFVCTKEDDGDVMFIEIIRKNDDPQEEGLEN